jgi:hypothetical protein
MLTPTPSRIVIHRRLRVDKATNRIQTKSIWACTCITTLERSASISIPALTSTQRPVHESQHWGAWPGGQPKLAVNTVTGNWSREFSSEDWAPPKGPTTVVQQNAVPASRYRPEWPFWTRCGQYPQSNGDGFTSQGVGAGQGPSVSTVVEK